MALLLSEGHPARAALRRESSPESHQSRLPVPPSVVSDCSASGPVHEFPNQRFLRKGGRKSPAEVLSRDGLLTVNDVEQGRDLARYARLDLSKPAFGHLSSSGRDRRFAEARTFIWDHWRSHSLAYLTLSTGSIDAFGTSHIFVEPDETGHWRVAWRMVQSSGTIVDPPTYYGVQWVQPQQSGQPGKSLPPQGKPNSLKHTLEFRDKCGDVEQTL